MHMSFRDIGSIINKVKLQAERERGFTNNEQEIDTESKSKDSQAFKLFSEGKTPVEVVIALDLPAGEVRAMYREFWELKGMYKLAHIYEEARYDLHSLLRLHKILKDLGMGEQEILCMFIRQITCSDSVPLITSCYTLAHDAIPQLRKTL
jgi:hypothetical protein